MRRSHFRYLHRPFAALDVMIAHWFAVPLSLWLVNSLFQRVLRRNSDVPFQVHFTSAIVVGKGIFIGRNVWKSFALSPGCYIQGGNGIYIGDDTLFAPGVKIISANHNPACTSTWVEVSPIRIGNRCWIGANAVILPGVNLGDDCIVGAGAVVTKSMPPLSVVVGNPAKPLPQRVASQRASA